MHGAVLVLLLDAILNDDVDMVRALIRRFPLMGKDDALTPEERARIYDASTMTDHFYVHEHDGGKKGGVVLADEPTTRKLVDECNLSRFVHWGVNTDPVEVCTAAQLAFVVDGAGMAVCDFFTESNSNGKRAKKRPAGVY